LTPSSGFEECADTPRADLEVAALAREFVAHALLLRAALAHLRFQGRRRIRDRRVRVFRNLAAEEAAAEGREVGLARRRHRAFAFGKVTAIVPEAFSATTAGYSASSVMFICGGSFVFRKSIKGCQFDSSPM
jgi:hypothetical protein